MAEISPQQLNSLYLQLHRSLLQYVGECWPWSDDLSETDHRARTVLTEAVAAQHENADRLTQPLEDLDWVVNTGGYPTAYTDLHYVSLKYLFKQVVLNEIEIIKVLETAASAFPDSPLLRQIADSERVILQSIQDLSAPKLAVTNVA